MNEHVLIKEEKYSGQYVVVKDFTDSTVVAHGEDPQKAYEEAVSKGYIDPVIFYVPSEDMVQIYLML